MTHGLESMFTTENKQTNIGKREIQKTIKKICKEVETVHVL